MDKLNNITRAGGYPLVAEGVEILSKHEDFITAIMDGMRISTGFSRVAVVLQYTTDMQGVLQKATIYYYVGGGWILNGSQRGKLLRLVGDGTTKLSDLIDGTVSKAITIQQTDYSVTDGGTTYPNAYSTVVAQLTTPQVFFGAVDFCYLKSLEIENKNNYLDTLSSITCHKIHYVHFQPQYVTSLFQLQINTSCKNFIRKSNRKIEIQLALKKDTLNFNDNDQTLVEIAFSETILNDNGAYPLNCIYKRIKDNYEANTSIGCMWKNNSIRFIVPAEDSTFTDNLDIIFISGVILL